MEIVLRYRASLWFPLLLSLKVSTCSEPRFDCSLECNISLPHIRGPLSTDFQRETVWSP